MGKYRSGKKSCNAVKIGAGLNIHRKASGINLFKNHRKGPRTPRRKKIWKTIPLQCQDWEFKVNPDNWFQGKVNVKPSDMVVATLKRRLTDDQQKLFRQTCFRSFLDLHEIVVNPQLIHQILLREVNQPNDQEIWFHIGNDTVRFGIQEFYLITGLHCTGDDRRGKYDSNYCRLKSEYFSNLSHITNDDVFDVFTKMPDENNRDVVIMGILFLLTQLII